MALDFQGGKNYVLGRGKVLIDRFDGNDELDNDSVGDGWRYIGNTPEFSTTGASEDLDHYDSDSGVKSKDDSVQLSMDRSGAVVTDNIDKENVAMLFGGSAQNLTVVADASVVETLTDVQQGRMYQLGESAGNPSGNRNITITTVKIGATTIAAPNNYVVDTALGMLQVLAGAPDIPNDADLIVDYALEASVRGQVISGTDSIYCRVKFIADNPKGINRDYYFPYVKLSPDGDYNLKGDDWQTMSFNFEILKRGSLESVYIDERAVAP